MHGEIFLLDRRLRHCCYTLLVFTHSHSTSWRLPQIFGRLPMRFLTSITRGHYPIKTARVLLSVNAFSWNTATRELREQGLCWPGTILSALSSIPSQNISGTTCFFFHTHQNCGYWFIYLLGLFVFQQSIVAIWEPWFKLFRGFSGDVHTRSVCCFNLQGGTDVILPTTTCRPYPLDWHWLSLLWLVQFLDCDLQASHWIYQITTNVLRWTSEQNDYHSFYIGDLVYLQRIRTWYYCHIDEGCKMGFLHHTGNWR